MKRTEDIIKKAEIIIFREVENLENNLIKFYLNKEFRDSFYMKINIVRNTLESTKSRLTSITNDELKQIAQGYLIEIEKILKNLNLILSIKINSKEVQIAKYLENKIKKKNYFNKLFNFRWLKRKINYFISPIKKIAFCSIIILTLLVSVQNSFAEVQLTQEDSITLTKGNNDGSKYYQMQESRLKEVLKDVTEKLNNPEVSIQEKGSLMETEIEIRGAQMDANLQKEAYLMRANAYKKALEVIKMGGKAVANRGTMTFYAKDGKRIGITQITGGRDFEYTIEHTRQLDNYNQILGFLLGL